MNYNQNAYGYGGYNMPQQSYQQSYQQGNQANFENTFAWVYSDAGAEAYPVAPGRTVLLMHYNEPILYLKSTDQNGRPLPMETYDLVRRGSSQAPNGYYSQGNQPAQIPQINMSEYVKNSELESKVNEIMNRSMNQNSMNPLMNPNSRGTMISSQGWTQEVNSGDR